ncbi:hypothetical protein [Porticoccus sp.]
MIEHKAKKFLKLGTAIRYLNDVKFKMGGGPQSPEPLGDNHVLDNIRHVLELTKELNLEGTLEAGAFGKLQSMYATLQQASRSATTLTMEQAEDLHLLARRIRESLLAEGNNLSVFYLEREEAAAVTSPPWPKELTIDLILKIRWSLAKWFLGLLVATFLLGVLAAETGLYASVEARVGNLLTPNQEAAPLEQHEPGTAEEQPAP